MLVIEMNGQDRYTKL